MQPKRPCRSSTANDTKQANCTNNAEHADNAKRADGAEKADGTEQVDDARQDTKEAKQPKRPGMLCAPTRPSSPNCQQG